MAGSLIPELAEKGVDVEGSLKRFMNKKELYEKFLYKFLEDDSFENYMKNQTEKNYERALEYIHSLKGLSANLGMNNIFKISGEIVVNMRAGMYNNIEQLSKDLENEYNIVCDVIKRN